MTTEADAKAAFLDALAAGESDPSAKAEGISPYFILYGGGSFEHLSRTATGFPLWAGKDNSHAAGRYQFEPATWTEQAMKLRLTDFGPASQDTAAWDLAATVYRSRYHAELLDDLLNDHLGGVAGTLRSTWTSLNPNTFPTRYRMALAARQTTAPAGPAPSNVRRPISIDDVKAWQTALRDAGFDPGPIDGLYGDRTDAAVQAWRRAQG